MKSESDFSNLMDRLKRNKDRLEQIRAVPLVDVKPTEKCPGVYIIFFEGKLQYIGASGNLFARIKNRLINGNRESHTLVNKLCSLRGLETEEAVTWLKQNARIKFVATDSEEEARLLMEVMIALNQPYFNTSLRTLRKEPSTRDFKERRLTTHRLDEWGGTAILHPTQRGEG